MLIAGGLTADLAVDRLIDLLPLLAVALLGSAILEVVVYFFFRNVLKSRFTLPYTLVAPAVVALLLFTVYPFFYNIRLAFSDLRLKTISCYIPNTDVTSAPCSLEQAAPNADVNIKVDTITARAEPNEMADIAFTLEKGDEVRISGKSSKINNYIIDTGTAMKISEDGTRLTSETCPAPITPEGKECRTTYTEFKSNVIDVQDERDWWPVEADDGRTGWIPDRVFFATQDGTLYDASTGDVEVGTSIAEGDELRLVRSSKTDWYQVELEDGSTGWIPAESVTSSRSLFLEGEAQVYAEKSSSSEAVGDLPEGQEVSLLNSETLTWYQVLVGVDTIGWVNIPTQNISTVEVFTAPTDTNVYESMLVDGPVVGEVKAGDELTLVLTDTSTDTTWYQVITADGTTGWVNITPTNLSEVEVFTLSSETPLYEDSELDSALIQPVPEGERVRLADRDDSKDVTWYYVRTLDRAVIGWTMTGGEVVTNFVATADADVYADLGAVGGVLASVAEGDRLNTVSDKPVTFRRHQVRLPDGTVGWLNSAPDDVVTTERDKVLYSLRYGWDNFKRVFVKENPSTGKVDGWGRLLQTENSTFPRLMRTTVAWTVLNVIFHLTFGMILALILNRPGLNLRGAYRAIIILPWAIPQPIIALAWKGEFNYQFGFVNTILTQMGLERVNWLYSPTPAFVAVTFVNIWLGIPFYMVTLLGGLQSIAGEYYEAAEIDGSNAWQRFRHVTVPLIRPVAVPIVTLDVIWTFNNFNVIYLITKGEPNESTNILVTALYNAAFGENGQFQLGFSAAFSLVIFAVLFLFASFWVTSSGALKGVYDQ